MGRIEDNSEPEVLVVRHEQAVVLRFNRPQTLNAFRNSMYVALLSHLEDVRRDCGHHALILTGTGRAFSSGHDLREAAVVEKLDAGERKERVDLLQDITRLLRSLPGPTIAAINGPAVGFGAEVTFACDFRLADPSAYFLFPELSNGLFFTNGTLELLPRLVGSTRAAMLLLGGERLTAEAALNAGLVSRVTPAGAVLEVAIELATSLATYAPTALEATLLALRTRGAAALEKALRTEAELTLALIDGVSARSPG